MGADLEYHRCGRPHDGPIFGGKLGVVRRGGGVAPILTERPSTLVRG